VSDAVRVFVNATAVSVPPGSSALDAVRAWRAADAEAVASGASIITDSRGLPIASDTRVQAGAIFRVIPRRAAGADGGERGRVT
jgi:hypothetical protein